MARQEGILCVNFSCGQFVEGISKVSSIQGNSSQLKITRGKSGHQPAIQLPNLLISQAPSLSVIMHPYIQPSSHPASHLASHSASHST
jgi:hypothetical protein